MGVLRRTPRSATVVAWNEVEVLYIGAGELEKFLFEFPRAMFALLLATEDRVAQATRGIADSDLVVERRLAKALVSLIEEGLTERRDDLWTIRLGQKDLASLTGCSIESAKKVVRAFRSHDLIDTGREQLTIANVGALQQIADGKPLASW